MAKTQAVLNVPDAYADPRFNPGFDKATSFRTRSILCAPMVARNGRLMGVLQVLNKAGGGPFSAEDEELLLAFASHAAIAIDRAQLVEAFVDKERIEESLRLAHDIQMAMLPRSFPERPGVRSFATLLPGALRRRRPLRRRGPRRPDLLRRRATSRARASRPRSSWR